MELVDHPFIACFVEIDHRNASAEGSICSRPHTSTFHHLIKLREHKQRTAENGNGASWDSPKNTMAKSWRLVVRAGQMESEKGDDKDGTTGQLATNRLGDKIQ